MKAINKLIFLILLLNFQNIVYAQNGNYATINETTLYYETYGEGEPFVLLHYWTGTHSVWQSWVDSLSKDYKLIVPDLHGHGKSTVPSGDANFKAMANDIYALLDQLEINKFNAMGASAGAMILLHMSTMDTSRIKRMVLIGGTTYFDSQYREFVKDFSFETTTGKDLENRRKYHSDEQIRWHSDAFQTIRSSYDLMNFTPPILTTIKCPTLIIHGDRDPFFNVDFPVEMYKSIPDSYLWIFPGGRHLPNWEDLWSKQFLTVLRLFLVDEL